MHLLLWPRFSMILSFLTFIPNVDRSLLLLQDESPILRAFRYLGDFLIAFYETLGADHTSLALRIK